MKTCSIICILWLALITPVRAGTTTPIVFTYSTDKGGFPSYVAPGIEAGILTRVNGAKKPGSMCSTGFTSKSFSTQTTYAPSLPAVEFTIVPATGYVMNLQSFTADLRRSSTGTLKVMYALSLDNGATWITQGKEQTPKNGSCGQTVTATWDFSHIALVSIVRFRIYGYGSSSAAGILQLLNVSVVGTCLQQDMDGDKYTISQGDCNDADSSVHPLAKEYCNEVDDNCNYKVDDGLAQNIFYKDANGDGYGENEADYISTCKSTPPAGYCTQLLPAVDMVITDSHVALNLDLWSFTAADFSVTGSGARDVMKEPFPTMVKGLHNPAMFWTEGATVRQQFYVTDTLPSGGLGCNYNCSKNGCEVIAGGCCAKPTLDGKLVDYFNTYCHFVRTFNFRNTITDNVVNGTRSDYYWELKRTKAKYIVFGQEENTLGSKYSIDTYIKTSNERIDSVYKFYPGVITVADAAPIYSKATGNINWNNKLAASTKAQVVDQYFNLNDFACTGNFESDTVHFTTLMTVSIPSWLNSVRSKFPKQKIFVTQYSPGETFHPNVEVYPGTFFAGTYNVRIMNTFFEWNKVHGDSLIGACYETLKSLIDKNNNPSLNYQMMEPIGNFFTESATMLNVETKSGLLIFGVKSGSGSIKLVALNYSGTEKKLPTNVTIDGKFTVINWGSSFKYVSNGPISVKPQYTAYTPANGMMKAWSEGYTEIKPVAEN